MNPNHILSVTAPLSNLQSEGSLPRQPTCERLSDVLRIVEPRLGAALLDETGRARLRRAADTIPASLTTFWGLEVRLGDPAPRGDLLWEVRPANGGVSALAGRADRGRTAGLASALRERSTFWRELGGFASEWLDGPDWSRRLRNIWLEADTASMAKIDVCLDRPNLFWGPNDSVAGADRDMLGRLWTLGRRFYGVELDRARVDAIVGTIPAQALIFQMGVMGARAMPSLRLCLKIPGTRAKVGWLAEIGWPGDLASLGNALDRLADRCGEVALNVDFLADRVNPKLGLEIYSAERTMSMDTWQPLLDELLAQGLARRDKLAALKDFPWWQRYRQFGVWREDPPLGFPVLLTNLHHLKLTFVDSAAAEAKAYLCVYRPRIEYAPPLEGDTDLEGRWR